MESGVAEDSDLEKTEAPSSRRLEQAREEGQVPQSRELSTFFVTITGVLTLWLLGGWMAKRMLALLRTGFAFERETAFDVTLMLEVLRGQLGGALLMLMPAAGCTTSYAKSVNAASSSWLRVLGVKSMVLTLRVPRRRGTRHHLHWGCGTARVFRWLIRAHRLRG